MQLKDKDNLLLFFLRAQTRYSVAVFGMFDGGESLPLAGEEMTTLMDAPEPPALDSAGKSSTPADTPRAGLQTRRCLI